MTTRISFIGLLAFVITAAPFGFASAQETSPAVQLGKLDFPNSGAPKAQKDFIDGILYLHSFEYEPARTAFQRAQAIDPSFALAYWGEAMTHHHSLWAAQRPDLGEEALLKFGASLEERAEKTTTQRERDFMNAAATVYGLTQNSAGKSKLERDVLYREDMRRMYEAYPGDHEVAAFYGLSILGVGSANRTYASYMRAAAVILPIWDDNKLHPGAAHYLIHSLDDPVHAIIALPMADAYIEIAPDAAHAQHMTSHIYTALGHWDDVVAANLRGFVVESAKTTDTEIMSKEERHYTYWLTYGRLQQGRWDDAGELLGKMRARLDDESVIGAEKAYYGAIIARYMFDTEDWSVFDKYGAPDEMEIPTAHYNFARAFAAIKRGDLKAAKEFANDIEPGGDGNPEVFLSEEEVAILQLKLDAMTALSKGKGNSAIKLMREAAERGRKLPFRYGPPRLSKPTNELLGDVLFETGDYEGAMAAYKEELRYSLRRTSSLFGLARAAAALENQFAWKEAHDELADIWHDADEGFSFREDAEAGAGGE